MSRKLAPEEWLPVGVKGLEDAAERATRSGGNTLTIAGPGAGKTELLAQRGCYLLQTGLCRRPLRILAISFKRDAARNLRDRVLERCGPELSRRFDSMTFDAFAKGLVDRFRGAIPDVWRPTADYRLEFTLREDTARRWLQQIPSSYGGPTTAELAGLNTEKFYRNDFIGQSLPITSAMVDSEIQRVARVLWQYMLRNEGRSSLNFQMIGRLAELLLRANPLILRALRTTYSYVFLDEFQDTTVIQYQLTQTAFLHSETVLTAVGDNKQRIMGWAGALPGIFEEFQTQFKADVIRLKNNYRSAPELVRILGFLSNALDPSAVAPIAVDDGTSGQGECRILLFKDHLAESAYLANLVEHFLTVENLSPRDICILTRNRPGDYTQAICNALRQKGIEARVESGLQDMLSEPAVSTVLNFFKIASQSQAPESRSVILDLLIELEGGDDVQIGRRVERQLSGFAKQLRASIDAGAKDESTVLVLIGRIIAFLDRNRLAVVFPQYVQGSLLDDTMKQLANALAGYLQTHDWSQALDALEGLTSVPIMTMHKSKGLEYHTVIFVGLEDSALWSFDKQEAEEMCGFFVAFSRARKRVLFTFCTKRPKKADGPAQAQQRRSIGRLYDLLQTAGVSPEPIEE